MGFANWLVGDLVYTAIVLFWAAAFRLDLGLRAPAWRGVWPWIALYIILYAAEWAIFVAYPPESDPDWVEELWQFSLLEQRVLIVVTGPIFEELLFRGALFSALLRRWGIKVAIIVPSLAWGLIHVGYEPWVILSIALSGMALAMIRWKSGSLYVPLALHAAGNLLGTVV